MEIQYLLQKDLSLYKKKRLIFVSKKLYKKKDLSLYQKNYRIVKLKGNKEKKKKNKKEIKKE